MTNAIAQAIMTPDNDVNPPSRQSPTSRASLISALEVGASASFVEPVNSGLPLGEVLSSIPDWCASLRNSLMSSVRQAAARTGSVYTVEVTNLTTPQRNMWIVAIVTRSE